jgi:flagellar motor switch/type III secretory pathway protein FliN
MTIKPLAESQVEGQEPMTDAEQQAILRLDIGEIQLSLAELLALRNGSEILLHSQLPIKCFMRVGTTTVAEGELDVVESGVRLTVREVLS